MYIFLHFLMSGNVHPFSLFLLLLSPDPESPPPLSSISRISVVSFSPLCTWFLQGVRLSLVKPFPLKWTRRCCDSYPIAAAAVAAFPVSIVIAGAGSIGSVSAQPSSSNDESEDSQLSATAGTVEIVLLSLLNRDSRFDFEHFLQDLLEDFDLSALSSDENPSEGRESERVFNGVAEGVRALMADGADFPMYVYFLIFI